MSRYSAQRPVGDDGRPIIGPDGRPLFLPHFQLPSFVVFDHQVDVRALGAYAFLQAFVDQSEGELSSSITSTDIAKRFGVSEETVMRQTDRPKNPLGLVPRLARAGALVVGPNSIKTRDCVDCGTPMASPCPTTCTSRKGRRRIKPRFELATHPPAGFCYPGPLTRWEYYSPERIDKRLRQNGQGREVVPFTQVLTWPALDQSIGLIELGTYVFIAAHTDLAQGSMATGEDLYRHAIARRFGWTADHVTEVTAKLERRRLISKAGLIEDHGRRHGVTSEPTSYVVRVMPPARLMHPGPIRVSEYRDPERITARQEAMRSVPPASPGFARVPSDLQIVDNPGYPQESTRANPGLWTGESGAVDGQIQDLRTHPTTHPQTHPSPSAQQPQPQGGVPHPRGAATDGAEVSQGGSGHDAEPPAAPAPDPLLKLIERFVPRALCKHGRQDQLKLLGLMQHLRTMGYPDERLELVFHGVASDKVLNPWAVVYSRIRSADDLERHLGVLDAAAAELRAEQRRAEVPVRCAEHGLECLPELTRQGVPRCLRCERRDCIEFEEGLRVPTTDGGGVLSAGEDIEELTPQMAAQALEEARQASHERRKEPLSVPSASTSPVRPGQVFEDMALVLEVQWSMEHCGRCNADGRYLVERVQVGGQVQLARVACRTCHR